VILNSVRFDIAVDVPTLRTKRLQLEPLAPGHSLGMFELWSNEEVCRYSGTMIDAAGHSIPSPVVTIGDSDRILDYWLRASRAGTGFRWALVSRATGSFLGTAGFNTLGTCSEYAYHLHPSVWGRGVMSEATVAALEWASSWQPCADVEAFVDRDNDRSIALLLRHGFEWRAPGPEGTDRYVTGVDRRDAGA
jgi:ribosomal-protein-alanine N-acetyltransferase